MDLDSSRDITAGSGAFELRDTHGSYSADPAGGASTPDLAWAAWFRLLVEHANDLIYLHEPDGKIIFVNRRLEEVTGWSREEIVGRSILEFLAPDYRPSAMARRQGPAMPEGSRRYETEVICRGGSRIPLEVHSTPVKANGQTIAWQGIARDIRERREAEAQMEAIYETARQVVGILNLEQVLSVIVTHAADLTQAQSCAVWLLDDSQETLYCSAAQGSVEVTPGERIAVTSDHPAARAFRARNAMVAEAGDPSAEEGSGPPVGVAAVACFPLGVAEGMLGVLVLCYQRPHGPEPNQIALLSTFASHAAAAIANARLFEAQRRKTQEAAAIGQVGMAVGTLDLEAALRVTGAYAYDLFGADLAVVLVRERGEETVRSAFVAERDPMTVSQLFDSAIPLSEHPLLAEVIHQERTLLVDDVASLETTRDDPLIGAAGLRTALAVPMSSRNKVDGALLVGYRTRTHVSEVRVRLAETLAQQAAVAIENATLFQAISTAKREWEATFDAIRDPVCIFSSDGILIRANQAAGLMFGPAGSLLPRRHYREILYAGQPPDSDDVFAECLAHAQPVTREVQNLALPGVFRISAYPLLDDAGQCTGVVEYIRDITTQHEMQARLYHSARLAGVGELAAGVVHNFRNVLMGVSGMLDVALMMIERGGDLDQVRERLADAQGHVFRGNQVLQRLLDFARGVPQEVADVSLDALLPDVVALCKAHPASRGIRIRTEIAADIPPVRADASQLHEVVVNLVLNALQAITGGGTVTIGAAYSDGEVTIRVADTGCGIQPEDLERIYEPFFSRRLQGPPGSGIGLSSSLRIVRAMGGDIRVESRVGEGTTFTIALPTSPGR